MRKSLVIMFCVFCTGVLLSACSVRDRESMKPSGETIEVEVTPLADSISVGSGFVNE